MRVGANFILRGRRRERERRHRNHILGNLLPFPGVTGRRTISLCEAIRCVPISSMYGIISYGTKYPACCMVKVQEVGATLSCEELRSIHTYIHTMNNEAR